jgi:hypothetical protein
VKACWLGDKASDWYRLYSSENVRNHWNTKDDLIVMIILGELKERVYIKSIGSKKLI